MARVSGSASSGKGVISRVSRNIRKYLENGSVKDVSGFAKDLSVLEARMEKLNSLLNGDGAVTFSPFVQKMYKMVGKNKLVESFSIE